MKTLLFGVASTTAVHVVKELPIDTIVEMICQAAIALGTLWKMFRDNKDKK